jgi:hypothetical protein
MRIGYTSVLALAAFCASAVFAQDFRATITGRVLDSSGASVVGAQIVTTNVETGFTSRTESTSTGTYTLTALPPGNYTLTVEMAGFKKFVREGLQLEVQGRPQIDVTLEPGDVQTTVNVSGEAPLLETSNASRGGVITGRTLVDLPLNGVRAGGTRAGRQLHSSRSGVHVLANDGQCRILQLHLQWRPVPIE